MTIRHYFSVDWDGSEQAFNSIEDWAHEAGLTIMRQGDVILLDGEEGTRRVFLDDCVLRRSPEGSIYIIPAIWLCR